MADIVIQGGYGRLAQHHDDGQIDQGHDAHEHVGQVPHQTHIKAGADEDDHRAQNTEACHKGLGGHLVHNVDDEVLHIVEVAKQRILEINPNANVEIYQELFMPETQGILDNSVDYIVDCVDTVTAKIELAIRAGKLNIPIISSMGTGNKLDPTRFEVTDIFKTSVCPLAKVMRRELKAKGIKKLKVVYSKEEPIKPAECTEEKVKAGSISFVPSVAGLIIAGEVVKDIIKE